MNKAPWVILAIMMVSVSASGLVIAGCSPEPEPPSDTEPATHKLVIDLVGKRYEFLIDQHGKLESKVEASSAEGRISILMGKGTSILDEVKKPPQSLKALVDPNPPPPPENTSIIGSAYTFNPQGITFNPGLFLTLSYDPEQLPPEINEKYLYVACHDGTEWQQPRYRKVDTEAHSVTTQIYHFSTCAILGPKRPAPPSTPPLTTGTRIGDLAPDFQLQSLDGQAFSLSRVRGKPVLVNFWASWCGPCRFEMPFLQEIYEEWSGKELVLVTIDVQESPSQVEKFIQSLGLSLPVLLDTKGEVAATYNIFALPITFFIDKDGIIRDRKIGAFTSKAEIEKSLNKIIP